MAQRQKPEARTLSARKNRHIGGHFADFLDEKGILDEVESAAVKRVIAWEISQSIQAEGLTKSAMAKRMHTSRAALDRLLDPNNISVTLQTLGKAAAVLGKKLRLELVDAQ